MIRHARVLTMVAVMCLSLVSLVATARAAADPNGTWKWKFTTQNGQEFELAVTLKAEGEKLTGPLMLPMGDSIDIKDGTFKNDEVSFTTVIERNGNTFTTKYKGKVEGDTIKGQDRARAQRRSHVRDWEAKHKKN